MGAGASSAKSEQVAKGSARRGHHGKDSSGGDLRGERYFVELVFLAPPENKRLSNNLALYFKGSHQYSPRILPSKVGKEEKAKDQNVFNPKVTHLGGTAYKYSFEFRDSVNYGELGLFWVRNIGTGPNASLRVQEAKITKVMSGGLQCQGGETYTFACHCNLLPGTEKHFFESRAFLPKNTPFFLRQWRTRELEENGKNYEVKEYKEGMPEAWNKETDSDLSIEHQSGIVDIKAQSANIILATGLGDLAKSNDKWACIIDHQQRDEGTSSAVNEDSLVAEIWGRKEAGKDDNREAAAESVEREDEVMKGSKEERRGGKLPPPASISAFNKSYWRNDVHFARQFLQGPHAEMLVACKDVSQLPEWLMRKREFIDALAGLQEGTNRINKHVMQEIAHGRIFILDLENVSSFYSTIDADEKGKFLALGPLCVFYLADDPERRFSSNVMVLLPLVITLDSTDSDSPVYSALDDPWLWQLAKCYISSADVQVQFSVSLLLNSLMALEPFAVSLHESLSSLHPIWKLLFPFLRYKCSESLMFRKAFLGESGILEGLFPLGDEGASELLREAVQNWSLEDMDFPMALAMRGLDGTDKLPEYPYRDDGLLVWCTLSDFVVSYIDCYYKDDESVEEDYEIQNFLKNSISLHQQNEEVDEEEMEAMRVDGKESLAAMITTILWLCTGYQTGLLKGLYESMAFIPDRPIFMSEMAPYEKPEEPLTEKDFLRHLPSKGATASTIAILFTLANIKESTAALSSKAHDNKVKSYVVDKEALETIRIFESNMAKVEKIIEQRNLKRDEEYNHMKPSVISCGAFLP